MLNLSLLLISFLVFSGCTLKPPNVEFCGKLMDGAHCKYILDERRRDMDDVEWMRPGRVSMSLHDFGKVKKFIFEACERSKKCDLSDKEVNNLEVFFNEFMQY